MRITMKELARWPLCRQAIGIFQMQHPKQRQFDLKYLVAWCKKTEGEEERRDGQTWASFLLLVIVAHRSPKNVIAHLAEIKRAIRSLTAKERGYVIKHSAPDSASDEKYKVSKKIHTLLE